MGFKPIIEDETCMEFFCRHFKNENSIEKNLDPLEKYESKLDKALNRLLDL
jgi:hypothetical protein